MVEKREHRILKLIQRGARKVWRGSSSPNESQSSNDLQSLDEVVGVLSQLNCQQVVKRLDAKGGLSAVEWTVCKLEPFITFPGLDIIPRSLIFTVVEGKGLHFLGKIKGNEHWTASDQGLFDSLPGEQWKPEIYTPVKALYEFLAPFASEQHIPVSNTDLFGFQFLEGPNKNDKMVRFRTGGVYFELKPFVAPMPPPEGGVKILVPKNVKGLG